jgi:hypothetical protein
MPKIKRAMIYKTIHRKLKIEQHEPHLKLGGELGWPWRVSSSCSTSGTHQVHVTNIWLQLQWPFQGRIQDFKLGGGGALKKIAPSGGRRNIFWGISCEKSRFYAKKSFFPILGGGACRVRPPHPLDPPLPLKLCTWYITWRNPLYIL